MDPSEETIRRLAHELWEAGGRRNDSHESDWLRAEAMIRQAQQSQSAAQQGQGPQQSHTGTRAATRIDESVRESFPASDSPSTHTPDVRPVNADAKWATARAAAEKAQNEASPNRAIKERKKSAGSRH